MLYRLAWDGCAVALRCDDRRLVDAVENYLDLAAEAVEDDVGGNGRCEVAKDRLAAGQGAAVMQQGQAQVGHVDLAVGVEVETRIVRTAGRAAG